MMTIIDEDSSSVSSGSNNIDDDYETGTSTSTHDVNEDCKEKVQISKKETEAVFRLRLIVFLILFLASIAVSLIVYFITAGATNDQYDSDYAAASEKVVEAFSAVAEAKIDSLASLGVAMIAHAIDNSRTWPYVTLSSFQQRASAARDQSGALDIVLSPLVVETERTQWESFVQNDTSWV